MAGHHQRPDAFFHGAFHADTGGQLLHQTSDTAVHGPLFGHHYGGLHESQNGFRGLLCVFDPDYSAKFFVPRLKGSFVASQGVDSLFVVLGTVQVGHHVLRKLLAYALPNFRAFIFGPRQGQLHFLWQAPLCAHRSAHRRCRHRRCRHRSAHRRCRHRDGRSPALKKHRSFVYVHQNIPRFFAPAAALSPAIPRPATCWNGDTPGEVAVVKVCWAEGVLDWMSCKKLTR